MIDDIVHDPHCIGCPKADDVECLDLCVFKVRPPGSSFFTRPAVLAVFAAILAAATLGTGVAKASPLDDYVVDNAHIVCSVLDSYPSVAGVEGIGITLIEKRGFTPEQAGEIVARSVVGFCPDHTPELEAFIAKWTRAGTVHA